MATAKLDKESQYYKAKLNLSLGENSVELCHGNWSSCAKAGGVSSTTPPPSACTSCKNDWWARVLSAAKTTTYYAVVYHDHKGAPIPGTARWQWLDNDETIWVKCGNACCQVKS